VEKGGGEYSVHALVAAARRRNVCRGLPEADYQVDKALLAVDTISFVGLSL
jgi:hypothetical protein